MLRTRFLSVFLAAFFSLVTSCADSDSVTLAVNVRTAFVAGAEFNSIDVDLFQGSADGALHSLQSADVTVRAGTDFVRGRHIADFVAPPTGTITVRVRLNDASGASIVQRRVQVSIVGDFVLTVDLSRECRNLVCPNAGDVAGNTECLGGHCVDPRCNPEDPSTLEFCTDVEFCSASSPCTNAVSACASAECIDGLCLAAPIDGACNETEYCDPDVGGGCQPLPAYLDAGTDASMIDASSDDASTDDASLDGGVDAMIDDASTDVRCIGEIRTRAGDPCALEFFDCSFSPPEWRPFGRREVGALCGAHAVCNPSGTCVPCSEGATCSSGCFTGITRCESGEPQCDFSTSPLASDGALCDQSGNICFAGESLCVFDGACDGDGNCLPCIDDSPCVTSDCHEGARSCDIAMPGCMPSATFADPGAMCGPYSVCASDHTCNYCVQGEACLPTDPCQTGASECSSGTPVCTPNGLQFPGTVCGDNQVCSATGACEDCIVGFDCDRVNECEAGTLSCFGGRACNSAGPKPPGGVCADGVCSGFSTCYPEMIVTQVAGGENFTCALRSNGHITCFGDNGSGQLGQGTTSAVSGPIDVVGITDAAQIDSSASHMCAVRAGGVVSCWGNNDQGQLGDPTTAPHLLPFDVTLPHPAVQVATGTSVSCALLDTDEVICWGDARFTGTNEMTYMTVAPTAVVTGLDDIAQIAVGTNTACARRNDGLVFCWGYGPAGAVGTGTLPMDGVFYTAQQVLNVDHAIDISMTVDNIYHVSTACAVRSDGDIWCWGANHFGSAGQPSTTVLVITPTAVPVPITDFVDVEVGGAFTLARRSSGEVVTFGSGLALGRPVMTGVTFDYMRHASDAIALGSGTAHSCIIRASGQLQCVGDNTVGKLGDGTATNRATLVAVRGP